MYSVLVAAIHSTDDLRLLQSTLQTRMQEATKMQVFQLWPFLTGSTNIATILYNVTDIVHAAYHLQRTETTPPVLYQLMQHVVQIHPDCNPLQSPTLMSTLKLIAEIHDQPTMSSHTEATVISILSLWGFSPMQVFGRQGRSIYTVWRSTALPDAEAFAFLPCQQLLQQQRYSLSDCSPSASMQLSGAAEGNHTMPAELTSSLQVCLLHN